MREKFYSTVRVRYGETDQMGYCYYGNFAQYLELGRVEALRSLGIRYKDLETEGIMLPVVDLQIKYISPAKYDDLLTIETRIEEIKGSRICFEYKIYNESNKEVIKAQTSLVFVAKRNMRPIKVPEFIVKAIGL
ncbi:MAG: acyl-CoA thioesterase [Bacteroidetes bacterium]|nr:acyl-CoA thioesterase [Bacteroidota bacterium]